MFRQLGHYEIEQWSGVSLTKRAECIYSDLREAQRESQRRETGLHSPELQRAAPHGPGRGLVRAGFILFACAASRASRCWRPPCPNSRPAFLSSASVRGLQQSLHLPSIHLTDGSTCRRLQSGPALVAPASATEVVRMRPTPFSGVRQGRLLPPVLGSKLTTMGERRWI